MLFKRFLIIFFSIFCVLSTVAHAEGENQFLKIQDAGKPGKTTLERWTEDQITASAMSVHRSIMGEIPKEFFDQLEQAAQGLAPMPVLPIAGMLGAGTKMVASVMSPPPVSGISYIASSWRNILGAPPAYAQGFGFKGLEFLLPLWRGFRNLVYVISSVIFVIIGLMIILRVKISPQAVVTIQSAVPAVITTLIMVTFSYAIAGLIIDISNLVLAVVMGLLFNMQGTNLTDNLFYSTGFGTSSGFPLISDIGQFLQGLINAAYKPFSFTELANPNINNLNGMAFLAAPHWWGSMLLGGLVGGVITGIIVGSIANTGALAAIPGGFVAGTILSGGLGNTVGVAAGNVVGGLVGGILGGLILPIIFSIMVGIWLIQLYFGLIKTYVTIIFKIIVGPLEIALGAFPNSKVGFGTWMLDLFANIMVFPIVTIFMALLVLIVQSIFFAGPNAWAPGIIYSSDTLYTEILAAAVGMAGLALVAKLPDLIPQYIFMIKPSPFGDAIGKNLTGIYNNPVTQVGGQLIMSNTEHNIRTGGFRNIFGNNPKTPKSNTTNNVPTPGGNPGNMPIPD